MFPDSFVPPYGIWSTRNVGASLTVTPPNWSRSLAVIAGPARDDKVQCEEVFGPVVTVTRVASLDDAIEQANATRYGLQAAIFSADLATCLDAARRLEFGGVTVNEAPTFRADQMPYGGVKASGNTKEGPAWTVRELTEERLVVLQL